MENSAEEVAVVVFSLFMFNVFIPICWMCVENIDLPTSLASPFYLLIDRCESDQ